MKNKYEINEDVLKIYLSNGEICLADLGDFDSISKYTWYPSKRQDGSGFYASTGAYNKGKRTTVYMHRLVMNFPEGHDIDHINHNMLDNRKSNLKVCTHQKNLENRILPNTNSTTGIRNLYVHKYVNKDGIIFYYWEVKIEVNGKQKSKLFPYTDQGKIDAIAYAEKLRFNHMENNKELEKFNPKSGVRGITYYINRQGKEYWQARWHPNKPDQKTEYFPYTNEGLSDAILWLNDIKTKFGN